MDTTDYLSKLPVDVFIQHITYLPFRDVIILCSSNTTLHNYCSNPSYSNNWKSLIDHTFSDVYDYPNLLSQIQSDLKLEGKYNYLVYVGLIRLLDPITQLMIYYRQNDMESFHSEKFTQEQRFLALLILDKGKKELMKYLTDFGAAVGHVGKIKRDDYLELINIMYKGHVSDEYIKKSGYIVDSESRNTFTQIILNHAAIDMAREGNMKGLLLMVERGANIHAEGHTAVFLAAYKGHLPVVKYLVENGVRYGQDPLIFARENGHIAVVKYLESKLNV